MSSSMENRGISAAIAASLSIFFNKFRCHTKFFTLYLLSRYCHAIIKTARQFRSYNIASNIFVKRRQFFNLKRH